MADQPSLRLGLLIIVERTESSQDPVKWSIWLSYPFRGTLQAISAASRLPLILG